MSGSESAASRPVIIAIDGPAGSGKSTTARALARRLGVDYIDTGALYRALTWWALRAGIVGDPGEIARRCGEPQIECGYGPTGLEVRVDGHDVSTAIREADVTAAVSAVSAIPEVRHRLVDMQRTWARRSEVGAVVEGRDIGTVVFPDATVKVYLDADPAVRAHRRHAEYNPRETADAAAIERTQADLLRRDAIDSTRPTSPLTVADDAVRIDSSGMGVEDVVSTIVALIGAR
jgi:cytidylate kinase